MTVSPIALPICRGCGGSLPPAARTGRPRQWCSDACRKKRERKERRRAGWRAQQGRFPTIPPDPLTLRLRTFQLVAELLEGRAPAAPEDQLAQLLLELEQGTFMLRRLSTELVPQLVGPAGELATDIERAILRHFPGRAA